MKSLHIILFVSLFSVAVFAQSPPGSGSRTAASASQTRSRGPVFRANKDQVAAAQTLLKNKGLYDGDATGKLDAATRESLKSYQKDNGLRATGTLNRATLEKMGISLTEKQKAIPVASSTERDDPPNERDDPPGRRAVFRATKEQVAEAQKLLKAGGMYAGEETGKLDDPTREGLRKYQEANGLKVTGTLNHATLEKMGVSLTDKQKAAAGTQQ